MDGILYICSKTGQPCIGCRRGCKNVIETDWEKESFKKGSETDGPVAGKEECDE